MIQTDRALLIQRAQALVDNGYGPIPIPTGKKSPPASSFIGAGDELPDMAKYLEYQEATNWVRGNLGVRIPPGVIVIDVDSYKSPGIDSWIALGGPDWPATVRVSARGFDQSMGHWFYRLPEGAEQTETVGGYENIDTLRFGHRYSLAPGSDHPDMHDPNQDVTEYQCVDFRTNEILDTLPPVADLPVLPDFLWQMLRKPEPTYNRTERGSRPMEVNEGSCPKVQAIASRGWTYERHRSMNDNVHALLSLHREGHPGVVEALEFYRASFITELEQNPDHTRNEPPGREFDRSVRDDVRKFGEPDADMEFWCGCADSDLGLFDFEVDFWHSRPILDQIWRLAKYRMVSPWALLGSVLARLSAETPKWVRLPPLAGGDHSLNLYVALVGPPSSGKSAAMAVAREMANFWSNLPGGWTSTQGGAGSGEGLAATFCSAKFDKESGQDDIEWYHHRVILQNDEITTLQAVSEQHASTLQGMLLSAWSGGSLSINYKRDNKINIPDHSYRLAVLTGAQPGAVEFITTQHGRGYPQRWLWLNSLDPQTDHMAPPTTVTPGATLPREFFNILGGYIEENEPLRIEFPADLESDIRRRLGESRAGRLEMRQHSDVQRMKVASLLAISEYRVRVEHEDWELADKIVGHSERMYDWIMDQQQIAGKKSNRNKGVVTAEITAAAEDAKLKIDVARVVAMVQSHAANPPTTRRGHAPDHCTSYCMRNYPKAYQQVILDAAVAVGGLRTTATVGVAKQSVLQIRAV